MSLHSAGWREVSRAAPVFAALGDETRLALVARLSSEGPLSITRLTAGSPVTRQAITKHLTVLATAGLVSALRRGAGPSAPGRPIPKHWPVPPTAGLVSDLRGGRERIGELEPEQLEVARAYLE